MATTVIRTEGLSKRYGTVDALKNLDLEIFEGEVVGYLGPNGAGKTTTIRLLLGLIQPIVGTRRDLRARLPPPSRSRRTGTSPTWPARRACGRRSPAPRRSICSAGCRDASTTPTATS